MLSIFGTAMQIICVVLIVYGGVLCLAGRDRREARGAALVVQGRMRRRSDQPNVRLAAIPLADARADRATDFEIGYRRTARPAKLAA